MVNGVTTDADGGSLEARGYLVTGGRGREGNVTGCAHTHITETERV